jgi:oryzin
MANICRLALFLGVLLPTAFAVPTPGQEEVKPPGEVIPGKYIVVLKEGISPPDAEFHINWVSEIHKRSLSRRDTTGVEKTYRIDDTFNGYAGEFDKDTIDEIKKNPDASHGLTPNL